MPYGYFPRKTNLGEQLGAGIAGFAENFRQAREATRQRRLQDQAMQEHEEDRRTQNALQHQALSERGIHVLGPDQVVPPSSAFHDLIAQAVERGTQTPGAAAPSPAATPLVGIGAAPNTGTTSGTFIDQLRKSFVGEPPPKSDRYQFGPGYYVDTEEAAQNQAPALYQQRSKAFEQAILPALVHQMTTPDPTKVHEANRTFDIAHPLPPSGPSPTETHAANRTFDIAHPLPQQPPVPSTTPDATERNLATLLPAIRDARARLSKYGSPDILARLASRGGMFTNWLNTDEGREFNQAATQYVQNVIYAKSGKAVTPEEARKLWDVYIPLPGDHPSLIASKLHTQELDEKAIEAGAGRAAASVKGMGVPDNSEQRTMYDAAAAHLKAQGQNAKQITARLGPRP